MILSFLKRERKRDFGIRFQPVSCPFLRFFGLKKTKNARKRWKSSWTGSKFVQTDRIGGRLQRFEQRKTHCKCWSLGISSKIYPFGHTGLNMISLHWNMWNNNYRGLVWARNLLENFNITVFRSFQNPKWLKQTILWKASSKYNPNDLKLRL